MILRGRSRQDSTINADLFFIKDFVHIEASDRRGPEMIPFFFNAGQDIRKKAHGYNDFKVASYLLALGSYAEALLSLIWAIAGQISYDALLGKPLVFLAIGMFFTYLGRNLHSKIDTESQISRLVAVQGNEDTARQFINLEKLSGEVGRAEQQWWAGYINRHADKIEKLKKDVEEILRDKYSVKPDLILKIGKPNKTGVPPIAYWFFRGKSAQEIADQLQFNAPPEVKQSYVYHENNSLKR
jgi:hypothetical protein